MLGAPSEEWSQGGVSSQGGYLSSNLVLEEGAFDLGALDKGNILKFYRAIPLCLKLKSNSTLGALDIL